MKQNPLKDWIFGKTGGGGIREYQLEKLKETLRLVCRKVFCYGVIIVAASIHKQHGERISSPLIGSGTSVFIIPHQHPRVHCMASVGGYAPVLHDFQSGRSYTQ